MKKELPINKLPKWAQDHIANLKRERDVAVRELNEWADNQTESPVSIQEGVCTGQEQGPSWFTRYVQTKRIQIKWEGVELEIGLNRGSSQYEDGISLQWSGMKSRTLPVAMIPKHYQSVVLISKENMR